MQRCDTCRYWDTAEGIEGSCRRIGSQDGCVCPFDLPKGELAQVQISYDYTGGELRTAAEFGCALHEPK